MTSGKLQTILKVLFLPEKMIGLAPFRFTDHGCEHSVLGACWSILVLVALSLLVVATSVWQPIGTLYELDQENIIVEASDSLEAYVSSLAMIVCVLFSFFSRKRICKTLNKLQAFDDILEKDHIPRNYESALRKVIFAIVFVNVLFFIYLSLEIVCYVSEETALQILNYVVPSIFTSHVDLQFCSLVFLLDQRFQIINKYYEENCDYWKALDGKSFNSDDFIEVGTKKLYSSEKYIYENFQKRTEYVRKRHYDLCEIVKELNDVYSPQLLFILAQSLITLISMVFFLANGFISSTYNIPFYTHIYTACVCFFCAVQIVAIIVVCVVTSIEAQRTAKIMFNKEYHLLRFKEFEHEIYFSVQLMHQNVQLEACRGLPITGAMLSTIIGTIITYLLIVIQFDINMEKINYHFSNNNTKV